MVEREGYGERRAGAEEVLGWAEPNRTKLPASGQSSECCNQGTKNGWLGGLDKARMGVCESACWRKQDLGVRRGWDCSMRWTKRRWALISRKVQTCATKRNFITELGHQVIVIKWCMQWEKKLAKHRQNEIQSQTTGHTGTQPAAPLLLFLSFPSPCQTTHSPTTHLLGRIFVRSDPCCRLVRVAWPLISRL